MKQLVIKGHATRGKEIIDLLEMLGAHRLGYNDTFTEFYYYIECGAICSSDEYPIYAIIFTLEEFEQKFPYKIGDKVCYQPNPQIDTICISEIIAMRWLNNSVIYTTSNAHELYACDLQPYKEETIEESANKAIFEGNAQSCDIMNDIIKKSMERIKIDIPEGYEFFGIDDNNRIVLTKIQPQYPKTYKECARLLNTFCGSIEGYNCKKLLSYFQQLLICRDAYWKIAGEEMGLNEPWKPDFTNNDEERYSIYTLANKVERDFCGIGDVNTILSFPTEEMRDAFYKNFKDLIEQCKELL